MAVLKCILIVWVISINLEIIASAKIMEVVSKSVPMGQTTYGLPSSVGSQIQPHHPPQYPLVFDDHNTIDIFPILESAFEVIRHIFAPISLAVSAISATVLVRPEPENITIMSPAFRAGVIVSRQQMPPVQDA